MNGVEERLGAGSSDLEGSMSVRPRIASISVRPDPESGQIELKQMLELFAREADLASRRKGERESKIKSLNDAKTGGITR